MTSVSGAEPTKVYIPDDQVGFLPANVVRHLEDGTVEVGLAPDPMEEDQSAESARSNLRIVPSSSLFLVNLNQSEKGCEDMVNLGYLHEPAILFNLRQRFQKRLPYTYTGQICIAVNPYEWLDIYGPDLQFSYLRMDRKDLPPHAFATSAAAYRSMRATGSNQSILVSGESGAGKTETTKILMEHLAYAGGGAADNERDGELRRQIISRVLKSNPLMEAFGNAKTVRNDNSSRFGKFGQLQFDEAGRLIGVHSETYLLEKSRVVQQGKGERNYHIFYQLLSAGPELREKVQLYSQDLESYPYVKGDGGVTETIEGESDAEHFKTTRDAMAVVGITSEEELNVFRLLAAVLHLGCVSFQPQEGDSDLSQVSPDEKTQQALRYASDLLGVGVEELSRTFCNRVMITRHESFVVPLNIKQADSSRSALSVAIYQRLFHWLVATVNNNTGNGALAVSQIGILDIFGFEVFELNSFEQFCINYANEKLQQKFNQDVFKTVQAEYEQEGIPWTRIEYSDNEAVLSLIEGKMGLLTFLNEECFLQGGSDEKFLNKVTAVFKDNEFFKKARLSKSKFSIVHYAGTVEYEVGSFLEKNKDELQPDLEALLKGSSSLFINNIFGLSPSSSSVSGGGKRRSIISPTVGTQFKQQLGQLMDNIGRTEVHYVRCIKPNERKSSALFSKRMVTLQLRYAGVIEAIRVSRAAFPNRILLSECLMRFRFLAGKDGEKALHGPVHAMTEEELQRAARSLLGDYLLQGREVEYQIGKTKVFFAAGVLEHLEASRSRAQARAAVVLQKFARGCAAYSQYRAIRRATIKIQSAYRAYVARKEYLLALERTILIQAVIRGYLARLECRRLLQRARAVRIQSWYRMARSRRAFIRAHFATVKIQAIVRGMQARSHYLIVVQEAREAAKLENQVKALQQRLEEERLLREQLEQKNQEIEQQLTSKKSESGASLPMAIPVVSLDGSPQLVTADVNMLEDMESAISHLRQENTKLKEANRNLKSFNTQLRKDNVRLERGLAAGGASFAAIKQKANDLHEQLVATNEDRAKLKVALRQAKSELSFAIKEMEGMRRELDMVARERDSLGRGRDEAMMVLDQLQGEANRLEHLNNRMIRGLLRTRASISENDEHLINDILAMADAGGPPGRLSDGGRPSFDGPGPMGRRRGSVPPDFGHPHGPPPRGFMGPRMGPPPGPPHPPPGMGPRGPPRKATSLGNIFLGGGPPRGPRPLGPPPRSSLGAFLREPGPNMLDGPGGPLPPPGPMGRDIPPPPRASSLGNLLMEPSPPKPKSSLSNGLKERGRERELPGSTLGTSLGSSLQRSPTPRQTAPQIAIGNGTPSQAPPEPRSSLASSLSSSMQRQSSLGNVISEDKPVLKGSTLQGKRPSASGDKLQGSTLWK